jgi:NAD-dependent dihydropyrimidine dehydrogenase PreA subunit
MIEIDKEACIGCGLCINDCITGALSLKDSKVVASGRCILCGHCVAICPKKAVSIPRYDMADVEECSQNDVKLDSEILLRAIKFRRSIRNYQPNVVDEEKLIFILQAGRYTATSKNTQDSQFIVVQKELEQLKKMVWDSIGHDLSTPSNQVTKSEQIFRQLYEAKKADPNNDFLFRNAPAVLFIASENDINAGLAAQNMELEAISLGLGMLYNGYLLHAIEGNSEVCEWLGISKNKLKVCALLGYPAVSYFRTAPHRAGNFILK